MEIDCEQRTQDAAGSPKGAETAQMLPERAEKSSACPGGNGVIESGPMEDAPSPATLRSDLPARLRAALPPTRFAHSLGVAEAACDLARRFGADEERAWLAGILHDCAKGIPTDLQAATCDRLGVALDPEVRACPSVIHGFLGAHLARTEYGVKDEAVLRAIRHHTIGGAGLTLLDRIIFLADAIEPRRNYAGVDAIRTAATNDLDEALRLFVAGQLRYLAARRVPIHSGLLQLWNELVRQPAAATPPPATPLDPEL